MITCACIPMTFQVFSNAICRGKYESSASHKIFFFWFYQYYLQAYNIYTANNIRIVTDPIVNHFISGPISDLIQI